MLVSVCAVAAAALAFAAAAGVVGGSPIPDAYHGYVETDSAHDAHLFYWGYGAQAPASGGPVPNRTSVPVVMWLQGGPGASSFYGDLVEFGPETPLQGKRGPDGWNRQANLLFVDNPVGTGFSYVGKPGPKNEGFVTTQAEVAAGLLRVIKAFFARFPEFERDQTPFWIFAESFGPKYATATAVVLQDAIKSGALKVNFRGVALGDGWLYPMGCVERYADYMYSISALNEKERDYIAGVAADVQTMVDMGEFHKAGNYVDFNVQGNIMSQFVSTGDIENYVHPLPAGWVDAMTRDLAPGGVVRKRFPDIPANLTFGGQYQHVADALAVDFLKPQYADVDTILGLGLRVAVYQGQFDVVVPVTCTRAWIQRLTWPGLNDFNNAPKRTINGRDGVPNVIAQQSENLSLFNILRAGHMAPADNLEATAQMLSIILSEA